MGSETTTTTIPRPNPFAIATWLANPWAMMPDAFYALAALVESGAADFTAARPNLVAQTDDDENPTPNPATRIVPAYGVLLPRPNLSMEMMGLGTSLQGIVNAVRAATEDQRVEQIILDVDSPGGPVAGVMEAAAQLSQASGRRRTSRSPLLSRYVCASSAYWIACAAADKIVASPSSLTGSIGVYSDPHRQAPASTNRRGSMSS